MTTRTAETRGFTLIELLIVVVIIGILASIAIPNYQSMRARSYRSALQSDLRNLAHQQEVYHNINFSFSSNLDDLGAEQTEGVTLTVNEASISGWAATASHAGAQGEQCGIYHGDAAQANGSPATQPGVIQCTF